MIHFQHDQKGATLRATEVKPKLDRFLIGKLGLTEIKDGKEVSKKDYKGWFISDTLALDYKMRITSEGNRSTSLYGYYDKLRFAETDSDRKRELKNARDREIPGIYYGNMIPESENRRRLSVEVYNERVDEQYKETVMCDSISLTIICCVPDLAQRIDECLKEFFLVTNFGTCQSKGYGSFSLAKESYAPNDVATIIKNYYEASHCYCFDAGNDPLGRIKIIYQIMKSGVNFSFRNPPQYQRSLLFLYMHEERQIGNEKAKLKQQNLAPVNIGTHHSNWQKNGEHPPRYVRALLGVGDHMDFKLEQGKTAVKIDGGDIARLSSPIFFKVIGRNVYYVGGKINSDILGRKFTFQSQYGKGGNLPLDVPTSEEIGKNFMDKFMEYCYTKFKNEKVLKTFNETRNVQISQL